MPSQSRRQYLTVEVKPGNAVRKAESASTSTSPSSAGTSPKAVRFATGEKVQPRALTTTEAWSLYHFEMHARQCHDCFNPREAHREGRPLCDEGHSLARDVAEHVYYNQDGNQDGSQEGAVYGRKKDNHKLVRIDMPKDYYQVLQLLKTTSRSVPRPVPIINYSVISTTRRTSPEYYQDERTRVVVEPNSIRSSRDMSKHKTKRHIAVVTQDPIEAAPLSPSRTERRRVYYDGSQREGAEAYEVELREPERKESRRRDRPKSSFWL